MELESLANRISDRIQSLHWGKCRCKGCRNMISKRAQVILEELRVVLEPDPLNTLDLQER